MLKRKGENMTASSFPSVFLLCRLCTFPPAAVLTVAILLGLRCTSTIKCTFRRNGFKMDFIRRYSSPVSVSRSPSAQISTRRRTQNRRRKGANLSPWRCWKCWARRARGARARAPARRRAEEGKKGQRERDWGRNGWEGCVLGRRWGKREAKRRPPERSGEGEEVREEGGETSPPRAQRRRGGGEGSGRRNVAPPSDTAKGRRWGKREAKRRPPERHGEGEEVRCAEQVHGWPRSEISYPGPHRNRSSLPICPKTCVWSVYILFHVKNCKRKAKIQLAREGRAWVAAQKV